MGKGPCVVKSEVNGSRGENFVEMGTVPMRAVAVPRRSRTRQRYGRAHSIDSINCFGIPESNLSISRSSNTVLNLVKDASRAQQLCCNILRLIVNALCVGITRYWLLKIPQRSIQQVIQDAIACFVLVLRRSTRMILSCPITVRKLHMDCSYLHTACYLMHQQA